MRRSLLVLTALFLIAPIAFGAEHTINTDGLVFVPQMLVVQVGDTVTWNNTGGFHNVTSDTGLFTSGDPSSDLWSFSFIFNEGGDYGYRCDVHLAQGMTGTVVVEGIFGDGFETGDTSRWTENLTSSDTPTAGSQITGSETAH